MLGWLKRLGLRWVMLYLVLYIASIAGMLPGLQETQDLNHGLSRLWIVNAYTKLWFAVVVPWVGEHLLHLPHSSLQHYGPEVGSTSIDTAVQFGCMLVLALAGAILWTCLDRDRQRERVFYEATRILVRYTLAALFLMYGLEKIWHIQMPYPGPSLLMTPVGDLSPTGLMWAFLGYSTLYELFGGLAEFVGGALLLFRRTTTLGALLIVGVMTNVIIMNYSFALGGPLSGPTFYAEHFLFMAIFLMAPDVLRLVPALLLDRAVPAVNTTRVWPKGWMGPASLVLKVLVIGWLLYYVPTDNRQWRSIIEPADKTGMAGLYQVEGFRSTDKSGALRMNDGKLWQRVAIQPFDLFSGVWLHTAMAVRTTDDAMQYFSLQVNRIDATHGRFILTQSGDVHPAPIVFRYVVVHNHALGGPTQPSNEVLVLDGKVDGAVVSMRLDRLDTSSYYLVSHKISFDLAE